MRSFERIPTHWVFWTQKHRSFLSLILKDCQTNSEAYKKAYVSLVSIFSRNPCLYSKLLSADQGEDLRQPKVKDYLDWLLESADWESGFWKQKQEIGLYLYLLRSLERFLLNYHRDSSQKDHRPDNQLSPITLMASEIFQNAVKHTDKLDERTHLCFGLHAEGLHDDEISALTGIRAELIPKYVSNAKFLIKEQVKKQVEH